MSSSSQCSNCSAPLRVVVAHGLCETCYVLSTHQAEVNLTNPTQTYQNDVEIAVTRTASGGVSPQQHDATKYQGLAQSVQKSTSEVFDERYEILFSLGSGGMGEVWKAFDRNTERFVAIKYIKSTQFHSTVYNRFLTEARSMANLKHTNVLGLYDFSVDALRPYMVLEFVDGQSLAVKLANFKIAPIPFKEVARIMEDAARGVHSAHESNVLHRDLKPSNIMVANDGTVKVLDFGLAKRTSDAGLQITLTSMIVGGTPGFTAPEQVKPDGETTPQTDVWGLGATLYALLAGVAPFPTGAENLGKVLTESLTPLRNRRIGTPSALEAVAMKCLSKNPIERYATALDLAQDLARFQRGEPVTAKKVTLAERGIFVAKQVPRSTWLALMLFVVVIASGASLAMLPKRTLQEAEQDQLRAGQAVTIIGTEHPEDRKFRSFFELNTLGKSVVPGSGSSFLAHTRSICELSPDPGRAQYFIEAEFQIRIDETNRITGQQSLIGMCFDHHVTKLQNNCTLMTFYAIAFHDYEDQDRKNVAPFFPTVVSIRHYAVHFDAQGILSTYTQACFSQRFATATQLPTPYKKIVVEIQPDCFRFWWNCEPIQTPSFSYSKPTIDKDYANAMIEPVFKDLVLTSEEMPCWSPRHGVGLYCQSAQLGVKNFKLTPINP